MDAIQPAWRGGSKVRVGSGVADQKAGTAARRGNWEAGSGGRAGSSWGVWGLVAMVVSRSARRDGSFVSGTSAKSQEKGVVVVLLFNLMLVIVMLLMVGVMGVGSGGLASSDSTGSGPSTGRAGLPLRLVSHGDVTEEGSAS